LLHRAKAEYDDRRVQAGDTKPWCDYAPPLDFPWPEYVETPRGREWWIPATAEDRALAREASARKVHGRP
jgi:aminobenzoyl-glutamate utilization protein B